MSTLIVFKSGAQVTVPHTVTKVFTSELTGEIRRVAWEPSVVGGQQIMDIQLDQIAMIVAIREPEVKP